MRNCTFVLCNEIINILVYETADNLPVSVLPKLLDHNENFSHILYVAYRLTYGVKQAARFLYAKPSQRQVLLQHPVTHSQSLVQRQTRN